VIVQELRRLQLILAGLMKVGSVLLKVGLGQAERRGWWMGGDG